MQLLIDCVRAAEWLNGTGNRLLQPGAAFARLRRNAAALAEDLPLGISNLQVMRPHHQPQPLLFNPVAAPVHPHAVRFGAPQLPPQLLPQLPPQLPPQLELFGSASTC